MQVISELISGVRGAENGQARIYRRASSTEATIYEDYDGLVALVQPLSLDSYGGKECYVNEEVDVRVQNEDGTVIRSFSPMQTANSVEYIGSAFTGARYSDALAGVNQPTSVQVILDSWMTSGGAPNWNVLFGGASVTLQVAVAGIANIFFNVKSPAYGAVGDGVADDTVAVQAAITAASAVKGIVLFPAGTYRTTAKLTVPVGVSLWGVGMEASFIKIDHATNDTLEYSATTSTGIQEIRGLSITALQANTGKFLSLPSGLRQLSITNSFFGHSAHTGDVISIVAGVVRMDTCFVTAYTSGSAINADAALAGLLLDKCSISAGSLAYTGSLVKMRYGTVANSDLSLATCTSGANQRCILLNQAPVASIIGCNFTSSGGTSTAIAIQITNGDSATTNVFESANRFNSGWFASASFSPYDGFLASANNPQIQNDSRNSKVLIATDNSATVDLVGFNYGVVWLKRSAAGGAQTLTSQVAPAGSTLTVLIENTSGGALGGAITFTTGFYAGTPVPTLPANTKITVCQFRSAYSTGGVAKWVPVAAFQNNI